MKPTHLEIVQGTPFEFLVSIKVPDEESVEDPKPLMPMPLTGCTVQLQARSPVSSSITHLNLSSNDTVITIDEEGGTFLIKLSSAETAALSWPYDPATDGRIPYQIEVTQPDGESFRAAEGTIRLDREFVR